MKNKPNKKIYLKLSEYIGNLKSGYPTILVSRKSQLESIAEYLSGLIQYVNEINLVFICTHNSRRSHIAQLWAWAAAYYFDVPNVNTFSGGTEATAFNSNAVRALSKTGFKIEMKESGRNPVYECSFSEGVEKMSVFSKEFSNISNPQNEFIAIMVCSDVDEACPYVPGAVKRFSLPYEDPKKYDGTDLEELKYDERTKQIATEIFYLFSKIKKS